MNELIGTEEQRIVKEEERKIDQMRMNVKRKERRGKKIR